jgi:hypothetical protein
MDTIIGLLQPANQNDVSSRLHVIYSKMMGEVPPDR